MRDAHSWKEYFSFSARERRALLVLAFLVAAGMVLPRFFAGQAPVVLEDTLLENQYARFTGARPFSGIRPPGQSLADTRVPAAARPFPFDPNTLDTGGWRRLGLQPGLIRVILHYREKGGRFRQPPDLGKIYGMPPALLQRLLPYVQIAPPPAIPRQVTTAYKDKETRHVPQALDINTATAGEWEALPGIGPVLAARIVKFRDQLGGFRYPEQLRQTYGLQDAVYQQILPYLRFSPPPPPVLDVNTATFAQLQAHPAIPSPVARAIVLYRQQHGAYRAVSDLRKIVFITDSMYRQISPLLVVRPAVP